MSKFIIYPNFGQVTLKVDKEIKLFNEVDTKSILLEPLVKYDLYLKNNKGFLEGEKVIVVKNNIEKKGILRTLTNEYVDLEINNILCRIREYSSILQEFEKNEDDENLIVLESPSILTYLFNSISWKPVYTVHLKNDIASLSLNANIDSVEELNGKFTLMTGAFSYPKMNSRSLTPEISSEKFNEYHSYELGLLKIEQHKPVQIFSKDEIEVSKYYSHDVNSKNIVNNGYSFVAPEFLPSGNVYVYISEDSSRYIGSFYITETLKEEFVELMIGPTTSVSCVSIIQEFDNDESKKVNIETQIFNQNDNEIDLTIRYYIGDSTLLSTTQEITERVNNFLEWDITIDGSQKNTYEIELSISQLN